MQIHEVEAEGLGVAPGRPGRRVAADQRGEGRARQAKTAALTPGPEASGTGRCLAPPTGHPLGLRRVVQPIPASPAAGPVPCKSRLAPREKPAVSREERRGRTALCTTRARRVRWALCARVAVSGLLVAAALHAPLLGEGPEAQRGRPFT